MRGLLAAVAGIYKSVSVNSQKHIIYVVASALSVLIHLK
jgi:hypothetical protein